MEWLTHITLLASGAVILVQEILKIDAIPGTFAKRYPVVTNIVLSIIAAVVAVWQTKLAQPDAWTDWLLLVGTISVVSAIVYNQLIGRRNVLVVDDKE